MTIRRAQAKARGAYRSSAAKARFPGAAQAALTAVLHFLAMTRRERKLLLTLIAAGLAVAAWKFAPRPRTAPQGVAGCNPQLWSAVYHAERLVTIEECKTAEGEIYQVRHEEDGDLHILLDVADASLINQKNRERQHGMLVLEAICQEKPKQANAIEPCANYAGPYFNVRKGMRVRVTGTYVRDDKHGGWMEIHPVTSLVPLP